MQYIPWNMEYDPWNREFIPWNMKYIPWNMQWIPWNMQHISREICTWRCLLWLGSCYDGFTWFFYTSYPYYSGFLHWYWSSRCQWSANDGGYWMKPTTGTILRMRSANERRRYIVTSSLNGWAHKQNDPWTKATAKHSKATTRAYCLWLLEWRHVRVVGPELTYKSNNCSIVCLL